MMAAGIAAWAVVTLLLVLTVVNQFPNVKWIGRLKHYDLAAVIPYWTFFAPTPGTTDTRLFWRELRTDGVASGWREVRPPANGGLVRAIWNPDKRQRKLIIDAGQMVARMASQDPHSSHTLVSLPYLLLLQRISNENVSAMTAARQFMVVSTTEDGLLQPMLASRWHSVDTSSGGSEIAAKLGENR
jgi:hypothetical protein